jgi:hypothetical protein
MEEAMRGISEEMLWDMLKNERMPESWSELIAKCQELNPWKPIETAPKDGTEILLYADGEKQIGFWSMDKFHEEWGEIEPTHWQELPDDPK